MHNVKYLYLLPQKKDPPRKYKKEVHQELTPNNISNQKL